MEYPASIEHLEHDRMIDGNLMFHNYKFIASTDGFNVTKLAISHSFRTLKGFLQLNSTHIIIIDKSDHCLFMTTRDTNITLPWIGKCGTSGELDGTGIEALFNNPQSVAQLPWDLNHLVLIEDRGKALRLVNVESQQVSQLAKLGQGIFSPETIKFSAVSKELLIAHGGGISKYNFDTGLFRDVIVSGISNRDLADHDVYFLRHISMSEDFVSLLNDTVLIVAGYSTHTLFIIDLKRQTHYEICQYDEHGKIDGAHNLCKLDWPQSLLLDGDTLYIGESHAIRTMKGI